jgi:hypothetical protein
VDSRKENIDRRVVGGDSGGFDLGFVNQHVREAIFHSIDAMALPALQALRILPVVERLHAGWADQNLEQAFIEHAAILTELLICDF